MPATRRLSPERGGLWWPRSSAFANTALREERVREKVFIIRISECLIKRANHGTAKELRMRRFGLLLLPLLPLLSLAGCGPNELFGPAAPPPPPLPTAPPPQSGNMADALALANMESAMIDERHALRIALTRASTPALRAFARKLFEHAIAREQKIRELAKEKTLCCRQFRNRSRLMSNRQWNKRWRFPLIKPSSTAPCSAIAI